MRHSFLFCLILTIPVMGAAAQSEPIVPAGECANYVTLRSVRGVLYKPENIHGGRGPTFLVQNPVERTGKVRLEVRDIKCRVISRFGLYATDWPYGARYYQKSRGTGHTARQLYRLARKAGSVSILVEGVDGKWLMIKNPLKREGTVYS